MKAHSNLLSLTLIITLLTFKSKAEIINAIKNNGHWNKHSTWDNDRLPIAGDTIIIPLGITVKIDENINYEKNSLANQATRLYILGKLIFENGKSMNLAEQSYIVLYKDASLGKNNSRLSSFVSIHLRKIWSTKEGTIDGPVCIGNSTMNRDVFQEVSLKNIKEKFLFSWIGKSDDSVAYYEISYSKNGVNWECLPQIKSISSDSSAMVYYKIFHSKEKNLYLKLESIDFKGHRKNMFSSVSERKTNFNQIKTILPKMLFSATILVFMNNYDFKK